ncbi:MAG: mandelate racemase/muconate lactonizing enzyme family protein [Chloroflexi bacterium]|nr:mandelate racemase/muconate lactonizing enzyme family protein [Chloroflexota bacterium]
MKITDVRPWIVTGPPEESDSVTPDGHPRRLEYVFIQVDTDAGLTGWGEITTYPGLTANRAIAAMIRETRDFLVGHDPSRIEEIWQRLFRLFTYMGTRGATTALISGIDIALWDIKGQALGVPIYELLGGPVRETVPLYTHFRYSRNVAEMAAGALGQVRLGAQGVKCDPFMAAGGLSNFGYLDGQISPEVEDTGVAMIAAIRAAVGPRVEVLIDAHALYNVPTAVRLATRLAPYNITWFEEPVPPESYAALKQVRDQVPTRICVGERQYTRFEFVPLFEQRLADYIMPDATWTGGISELKKIATLAEAYYVPISPHDASGPVNLLAGAHVAMTTPNFYRLEARRIDMSFYNAFVDEPLVVRDGALIVPRRPGLGIALNLDYLRANTAPGGSDERS